MTRYAALLRAVNVAGRRMRMADLRSLLSGLGYEAVATLLQSGNAVFTAPEQPEERVAADIERRVAEEFGLRVTVVVRTAADLARAVDALPFPERDPARCAVVFPAGPLDRERLASVRPEAFAPEELAVGQRELYLYLPDGLAAPGSRGCWSGGWRSRARSATGPPLSGCVVSPRRGDPLPDGVESGAGSSRPETPAPRSRRGRGRLLRGPDGGVPAVLLPRSTGGEPTTRESAVRLSA